MTVAVARKLIEQGRIPRDEEIVLCITGNGLKTMDALYEAIEAPVVIKPSLEAFDRWSICRRRRVSRLLCKRFV